jgi:hypothetical protein
MKTRHSSFLSIVLLVSLLGATAMACPDCPACTAWNGSSCEWDCASDGSCCGFPGSQSCCNNSGLGCCVNGSVCLDAGENCCANAVCENACCVSGCCTSSTDRCCGTECWGGLCCGGKKCGPSYTQCCGSANQNCCEGQCCGGTQCCGAITGNPHECCDDTACYDTVDEECCGDGLGTFCAKNRECCDGGICCLVGESCCDGECTDECWTTEDEPADYAPCGCILGICGDYYFEWPGKTMCVPAGAGVNGHCKCIEKTDVIKKTWDCEGEWDEQLMNDCAMKAGICLFVCSLDLFNGAGCSDCLCNLDADCCGGDGCEPCDFRDCHKDLETEVDVEGLVFDHFEGDTCNNDPI